MYSQQELDDAVASGVITADAADALRAYIEQQRSTVIPDEEQFRLLTGFNDIFVSIAAAILLFAVGWIGQSDRSVERAVHHRSRRDRAEPSSLRCRCGHIMGPGAVLHGAPANGAALDPAAPLVRRRCAGDDRLRPGPNHRIGPVERIQSAPRLCDRCGQCCGRRGRRVGALAPFPCADHRCRRCGGGCWPVPGNRSGHRPAARRQGCRSS